MSTRQQQSFILNNQQSSLSEGPLDFDNLPYEAQVKLIRALLVINAKSGRCHWLCCPSQSKRHLGDPTKNCPAFYTIKGIWNSFEIKNGEANQIQTQKTTQKQNNVHNLVEQIRQEQYGGNGFVNPNSVQNNVKQQQQTFNNLKNQTSKQNDQWFGNPFDFENVYNTKQDLFKAQPQQQQQESTKLTKSQAAQNAQYEYTLQKYENMLAEQQTQMESLTVLIQNQNQKIDQLNQQIQIQRQTEARYFESVKQFNQKEAEYQQSSKQLLNDKFQLQQQLNIQQKQIAQPIPQNPTALHSFFNQNDSVFAPQQQQQAQPSSSSNLNHQNTNNNNHNSNGQYFIKQEQPQPTIKISQPIPYPQHEEQNEQDEEEEQPMQPSSKTKNDNTNLALQSCSGIDVLTGNIVCKNTKCQKVLGKASGAYSNICVHPTAQGKRCSNKMTTINGQKSSMCLLHYKCSQQ